MPVSNQLLLVQSHYSLGNFQLPEHLWGCTKDAGMGSWGLNASDFHPSSLPIFSVCFWRIFPWYQCSNFLSWVFLCSVLNEWCETIWVTEKWQNCTWKPYLMSIDTFSPTCLNSDNALTYSWPLMEASSNSDWDLHGHYGGFDDIELPIIPLDESSQKPPLLNLFPLALFQKYFYNLPSSPLTSLDPCLIWRLWVYPLPAQCLNLVIVLSYTVGSPPVVCAFFMGTYFTRMSVPRNAQTNGVFVVFCP